MNPIKTSLLMLIAMPIFIFGQADLEMSGALNTADNNFIWNSTTNVLDIKVTVQNTGNDYATTFRTGFYLSTNPLISTNDMLISTVTKAGLNFANFANRTTVDPPNIDLDRFGSLANGKYYVGFIFDDTNIVTESNETNNIYGFPVNHITFTRQLPNLILISGSGLNNSISYDSATHILKTTVHALNNGTESTGDFQTGFYLSTDASISTADRRIDETSYSGLPAGGRSFPINSTVDLDDISGLSDGTYYVGVIFDWNNQVGESNENDNNFQIGSAVQYTLVVPMANLTRFTGAGAAYGFNYDGGTHVLTINTCTQNNGTVAAGAYGTAYYLSSDTGLDASDIYIGSTNQSGLAVGAHANYQWVGDLDDVLTGLDDGDYYIIINLDNTGIVAESSNTDNVYSYSPAFNTPMLAIDDIDEIAKSFKLHQNYPNPFNPITTITYDLPQTSQVVITVYDLTGKIVTELINSVQDIGQYSIDWDGTDQNGQAVSAGVYIYQLRTKSFLQTLRMLYVK